MRFIYCACNLRISTFHPQNPALQDSVLSFNQNCELVSQLPIAIIIFNFILSLLCGL